MAVTYPRDVRALEPLLALATLNMVHNTASVQMKTGAFSMDLAPGRWSGSFTTRILRETERRPVEAFVASLSGGKTFLAYDRMKCYPAKHQAGAISGAWSDTLVVDQVTTTTIRCAAPNANLRMAAGDFVGLEASGKYSLHRVLSDAQPSSGLITLDVAPIVSAALFPAGSVLRLVRPVCQMILDPSKPVEPTSGEYLATVSFSGVQAVF